MGLCAVGADQGVQSLRLILLRVLTGGERRSRSPVRPGSDRRGFAAGRKILWESRADHEALAASAAHAAID